MDIEIITTENEKIYIPDIEEEIYNIEIRKFGRKENGEPRWWVVQRPARECAVFWQGAVLPTDILGSYEKKEDALEAVMALRDVVKCAKFAVAGLKFFGMLESNIEPLQFDMNLYARDFNGNDNS